MLQKLPNNSITNTESQLNTVIEEYTEVVSDVLEAFYAHSLRPLPENYITILTSWTSLFMKAGIPSNQLMDIYLEAHINLEKGGYFNVDSVLDVWKERRIQRLQEERQKEVCPVCRGNNKRTMKFDFELRKDVEIDCPKCV